MRLRYPQPGNEEEFEDFCLRYYRHSLERGGLVRYGKRGERQDGIDIIDQHCMKPLYVVQCKNHEPTKAIPPQEIKDEVAKLEQTLHPVDFYIIATTARKSRNAQDAVLALNQRNNGQPPFKVEIHFWEDICARLDEFGKAVADFLVWGERTLEETLRTIQLLAANTSAFPDNASTVQVDATELHLEISTLFDQRKIVAVEHEIAKLADPETDSALSREERYSILRLKAKLAVEHLRFDEAARLFKLAHQACPEIPKAQQNYVFALELSGDRKTAFKEAEKLIDQNADSSYLVSLLIRNCENETDLDQYRSVIDDFAEKEEDVNLALVTKFLAWDEPESAEKAANRALTLSPTSAHALFWRGAVDHHCGMNGDWRLRADRLKNAISHYTKSLKACERDGYRGLLPEVLNHRARVNGFLGNRTEAERDYRRAVEVSEEQFLYAESAVSFFLQHGDFESAWEFVPLLSDSSNESRYLTGVIEYYHGPKSKKRELIEEFGELASINFDRAVDVRFHCVEWAIALQDYGLALEYAPNSFLESHPLQGNTLRAWIALESGDTEGSHQWANKAIESSSRSANRQEIAVLANLLMRIGSDEKALPLCEKASIPGVLNDDCKRLLECAQRLDRQDTLLRICSELRETDQQDNRIRRLEVELLSHYAPERAFSLAEEFTSHDHTYFSVARNYLAVQLGDPSQVKIDNEALPSPADFPPEEAYLVVTPYIEIGRYLDAIDFAYQQLRRYFSNERAHGQYIWVMLEYGESATIPSEQSTVTDQSAVQLQNLTTNEERWLIIEDDQPDTARNEVASSTPAAQSLIGKRVGDVVCVIGGSLQLQSETVTQVQHKYVRLFQETIANFQNRFPGSGAIQSIHLGKPDSPDTTPIVESLKGRQKHVKTVTDYYREKPCSLHLLGTSLGVNLYQLISLLAIRSDMFIRCVDCSPEDFDELASERRSQNRFVLDLSAIVTIALLNSWSKLPSNNEYLISRATKNTLAEWLAELEDGRRSKTYATLSDDGRFSIEDVPREHLDKELSDLRTAVEQIDSLCVIRDSMAISELDPKRRERYLDFLGICSLESLSVAKDEDALIWTDDLCVAIIGESDFGVKRTWTQQFLKSQELNGDIELATYRRQTAMLAAWNYAETIWSVGDLVAAGEKSGWDVAAWPFRECLALIGSCPLKNAQKAQVLFEFFGLLRRSSCVELKHSVIIQTALDHLGHAATVRWMLRRVDQAFPIDFPTAEFLKAEFAYWLRLR
ncbi:Tetratricopeptide repeat protein [Rosistilla oblonga]|nr:hypothetical protein [Rosistilla oblonga]QDV12361.1 Tetratricopeptide repeat protein [Rosistilla oblonga]